MKALILASGYGTRLNPITLSTPKCMVSIAGKSVLERQLEYLEKYGITKVMVNLHYLAPQIYEYFGSRLVYLYEKVLLGEEKTIEVARPWLGEEFVVMNGDTLTDLNINELIGDGQSCMSVNKNDVYTGIKYYGFGNMKKKNFNCWWQDMGTHEGLEKARKHYD